jgi:hypothetical protein
MVPRTPILHGSPCIIRTCPRSTGRLRIAIDAVHVRGQPLANAVPINTGPMNTGAIAPELVVDNDCDILSILSIWYGKFQKMESKKYMVLEK